MTQPADDKPTVREAVAAAISGGSQDRAGILGSAQLPRSEEGAVLTRHHDESLPFKERLQVVERDGKDLGLELAALLLRAKYAQDHSGIRMANFRFALRLKVRTRRVGKDPRRRDGIVIALASQSIAEWLTDRCERCKGTGIRGARMGGVEELLRGCTTCKAVGSIEYVARGVKVDARGKIVPAPAAQAFRATDLGVAMIADGKDRITLQCPDCRGMRYRLDRKRVHQRLGRTCERCGGDGEALPRYADRARALGIGLDTYRRCWHSWFDWSLGHLTGLDKTLVCNLRSEFGCGYSPTP